jgi:hypothetical protein
MRGERERSCSSRKSGGMGGGATGVEIRRLGWRAAGLVGAGAGWARSLVAPAHGLGAGRNAGGDFGARRLLASLILRFAPMEPGFLALFGVAWLGGSGVLVMTVKGPAGTRGGGNRAECAESEREASSQQEFLHFEHLNRTISSIWGGERLLYGRTVLRRGNGAGRLGMRGQPRRAGIRFGEPKSTD